LRTSVPDGIPDFKDFVLREVRGSTSAMFC
jgi:hypothetical protein